MSAPDKDVVVMGAGIAGLTTAWRLTSAGWDVQVLEASGRIGGRIYGFNAGGRAIQLGGRWTGPGQDRLAALATEFGISIEDNDVFSDAGLDRMSGEQNRLREAIAKLDALAETVPLDAPWSAENAASMDTQTVQSWLLAEFDADTAASLGRVLTSFLPNPGDASVLHAAFYLHSNGGLAGILGLNGPAHDSRMLTGGAHRLTEALAQRLEGRILLESPVSHVQQTDTGVHVRCRDGAFTARHAVVAMPPTMAGRLIFEPAMPPERDYLTQRCPIRGKIVAAFLYDEPFWRDQGHRLFETERLLMWDEGGEQTPAALAGLISIDWSAELWQMPKQERRAAIQEEIAAILGEPARHSTAYHEIYWAAEPWTRGCNSFLTPGAWTQYGRALRPSVGRIHWAGAEYSPVFVGQMDGAIRSAESSADKIDALLKSG